MTGRINQTDPATGLAFVNAHLWVVLCFFCSCPGKPPQTGTGTGTIQLYLSDINDRMPALVAPALDVCDKKEGTALVIEAKPAVAHSHSGPFTFELAEDSEDVKHNWTLGRSFGEFFLLCPSWVHCQLWALWLFHCLYLSGLLLMSLRLKWWERRAFKIWIYGNFWEVRLLFISAEHRTSSNVLKLQEGG